jgi:hypothetical protein
MSILDTFFLLFEADTADLERGLDKARKKGKDTAEDLRAVDAVAHKLGRTLGDQLRQLGGALLGAVAVRAMAGEMMAAAEHADKLNESAERLGLNIESLSAWGDLTKKNGGSMEAFTGGIQAFNRQLVQMEATGKSRAAPFLKELGIDLEDAANKGKTAMDFLPQLADAFKGMDGQKAQALGSRLGLDAATIMTLQAGRREVEALLEKERELGVVTKAQGEIADKFGDQLDDTKHAFRSMWTEVATAVLPALTWFLEKFQNVALFMRKHSDFIVGLMIALGAAVLFYAVPPLVAMGAAAIVAFAPFLLLGAIVAGVAIAFALLYDDVQNFIKGNDSAIGAILQKWPVVGDMAKAMVGWLRFLWDVAAGLLQFLVTMWTGPGAAWDEFVSNIGAGIERLLTMFPALGEAFSGVADLFTMGAGLVGEAWDSMVAAVTAAIEAVMGAVGAVADAFGRARSALGLGPSPGVAAGVSAGRAQLGAASDSAIGATTSSAISNTRGGDRSVKVEKVEVHTQATDAQGIARGIGGALGSQMRGAASQFDDGVLA